jgi:hypothetical protein
LEQKRQGYVYNTGYQYGENQGNGLFIMLYVFRIEVIDIGHKDKYNNKPGQHKEKVIHISAGNILAEFPIQGYKK